MIDGWSEGTLANWIGGDDERPCPHCGEVHRTNPVHDYVMRSLASGLRRTAAVDPEYAERKRESLLKQLEPQKWAKEPFDPRRIMEGDVVRNTSPEFIWRRWGGEYVKLFDAIMREAGVQPDSDEGWDNDAHFTISPGNLWRVSKVRHSLRAIPLSDELFLDLGDGQERKVPLTEEIREIIGDAYWIAQLRVEGWSKPPKMVKRGSEYDGEGAGLTNLQVISQLIEGLDPEAATIYPWIAEEVKAKRLNPVNSYDLSTLDNAIPFIEWQRMYGDREVGGGGFDPKGDDFSSLRSWVGELESIGLDPETNSIYWDDEDKKVWEDKKGNYAVVLDPNDSDSMERHGEMLSHCYADSDSSYGEQYRAPIYDGNQIAVGLRSQSGRPLASLFIGLRGRRGGFPYANEWVPLEVRANDNQPLDERSVERSGKNPVSDIMVRFYNDVAAKYDITVDRSEENDSAAYDHHEFGYDEERRLEERREHYGDYWHDGESFSITDLDDAIDFKDDFDRFTASSEYEYDDDGETRDYQEAHYVDEIDWEKVEEELVEHILELSGTEESSWGVNYDEDELSQAIAALATAGCNMEAHGGRNWGFSNPDGTAGSLEEMARNLQRRFLTSPTDERGDPLRPELIRIATRIVGELNVAAGAVRSVSAHAREQDNQQFDTGTHLERFYNSILHGFELLKSNLTDVRHRRWGEEPLEGVEQDPHNPFLVNFPAVNGRPASDYPLGNAVAPAAATLPGVKHMQVPLSHLTTPPKFEVGAHTYVGYLREPGVVVERRWLDPTNNGSAHAVGSYWQYEVRYDDTSKGQRWVPEHNLSEHPEGPRPQQPLIEPSARRVDEPGAPANAIAWSPTHPAHLYSKVAAPVCRHCGEPAKTIMRFGGGDEVPVCFAHEHYEAQVRKMAGDPYRYERIKVAVLASVTALRRSEFHFGAEQDVEAWYAMSRKSNQKAIFQLRKPVTLEVRGGKIPIPGAQPIGESQDGLPIYRTLDLGWHPELQQRVNADSGPNGAPEWRDQYADLQPGRRGEVVDIEPFMKMVLVHIPLNDVGKLHPHYATGWVNYDDIAALSAAGDPFRPKQ